MGNVYLVRGADGKVRMECDPVQPDIIDVEPKPQFTQSRVGGGFRIKAYAVLAAILFIPIAVAAADWMHVSPEEAAYKAALQRQKAMQSACVRITEKVAECYTGSKESCKQLQESNAWFASKEGFGEYPEYACPNAYDPLVLAPQKGLR